MYINFHLFVFISTIIYYFVLKLYKNSIESSENSKNKRLIFVLFIPIILYITFYIYYKEQSIHIEPSISSHSKILSNTYPASLSTSF